MAVGQGLLFLLPLASHNTMSDKRNTLLLKKKCLAHNSRTGQPYCGLAAIKGNVHLPRQFVCQDFSTSRNFSWIALGVL